MLPGDEVSFGTELKRVVEISSPTNLKVDTPFTTTETGLTMVKTGISDVWNDRFLKRYATAMLKLQWGNNLSKFAGIQMPGGVTLDGVRIATEAQVEIDKIEEEMQSYNVLPGEFFLG
jgi:hypothetical protein